MGTGPVRIKQHLPDLSQKVLFDLTASRSFSSHICVAYQIQAESCNSGDLPARYPKVLQLIDYSVSLCWTEGLDVCRILLAQNIAQVFSDLAVLQFRSILETLLIKGAGRILMVVHGNECFSRPGELPDKIGAAECRPIGCQIV